MRSVELTESVVAGAAAVELRRAVCGPRYAACGADWPDDDDTARQPRSGAYDPGQHMEERSGRRLGRRPDRRRGDSKIPPGASLSDLLCFSVL